MSRRSVLRQNQFAPVDLVLLRLVAQVQYAQMKYQESAHSLVDLVNELNAKEGNETLANTFFMLGKVQLKLKEKNQSFISFKKCLSINSSHYGANIHLGDMMLDFGKQKHAAVFYKNALKANPGSASATFGLMTSVGASSHLKTQCESDPDNFTFST